jgi:hypothetical protein
MRLTACMQVVPRVPVVVLACCCCIRAAATAAAAAAVQLHSNKHALCPSRAVVNTRVSRCVQQWQHHTQPSRMHCSCDVCTLEHRRQLLLLLLLHCWTQHRLHVQTGLGHTSRTSSRSRRSSTCSAAAGLHECCNAAQALPKPCCEPQCEGLQLTVHGSL